MATGSQDSGGDRFFFADIGLFNVFQLYNVIRQLILLGLQAIMTLVFIILITYVITMHSLEDTIIMNKLKFMEGRECIQSHVPMWYPEITKFIRPVAAIKCDKESDWVVVEGSTAFITSRAKKKYGHIVCFFTDIFLRGSSTTFDGSTSQTSSFYKFTKTDSVRVNCKAQNGKTWQGILAGIREDTDVVHRGGFLDYPSPHSGLMLDVLVWCVHGMSRHMFGRILPLTQHYLHQVLGAIDMESFNVAGQDSSESLLAALTGRREEELPGLKQMMSSNSSHVVIYPFVWSDFRAQGYVTGLVQDHAIQQQLMHSCEGVYSPSVDHSMSNFFIAAKSEYSRYKKFCMGSLPRHKVMMNYALNFFQVYQAKPKLLFGFLSELSQDSYNTMGAADRDMSEWLSALNKRGHLNHTLLVVMSDHGTRSSQFNNTLLTRLEERMPFLSIVVPTWFDKVYPDIVKNLHLNSIRLTTPFDIYATLMDVLRFEGTAVGDNWNRGISLLKEIPLPRVCHDATITNEWCTCLAKQVARVGGTIMKHVVRHIVDTINRHTEAYRNVCSTVWMEKVSAAIRLQHHTDLLSRPSVVKPCEEIYQLKFYLGPRFLSFEAQVSYNMKYETYHVELSNILRISPLDLNCTKKIEKHLYDYCICE